ncbi:MAG: helix-turn-helix domain-containing protein [Acidobacteriota bacterium]|nr:helix-turn-helix domain-containing protein [Acidobacteriota bacterium]
MSDIFIIGRAAPVTHSGPPPAISLHRAREKAQLTLSEAAAVSGVPVHLLKEAIYSGALPASRRGRVAVERVELDEWLREMWQMREP